MSKFLNSVSKKALAVAALLALSSTAALADGDKLISGDFGASYNSHFVSFGVDVWGAGDSFFGSRSTTFVYGDLSANLGDGFALNWGAWAEVNRNAVNGLNNSLLGGGIQEVDAYVGLSYAVDAWSLSGAYQAWNYGSDVEQAFEFGIGYNDTGLIFPDFAFNPKLTIHARVDGNGGQKEGTIMILGVGPAFPLDDIFTISVPAGIAFFIDDNYQGGAGETVGYGYIGGSLGVALPIPSSYGTWSANFDLIGYFTSPAAIPTNVKSDFVTGSFGVKVAF